jgi:hypothetical protein
VSPQDAHFLSEANWYTHEGNKSAYAAKTNDDKKKLLLHRAILGDLAATEPDHNNHNGFDNRRQNLRLGTHSQNIAHSRRPTGRSGFRGVHPSRPGVNRWRARINIDGKWHHLGTFPTAEEAARVYDKAAIERYGRDFAMLNFPDATETQNEQPTARRLRLSGRRGPHARRRRHQPIHRFIAAPFARLLRKR